MNKFWLRLKEAITFGWLPSYWGDVPPPISACKNIRPEVKQLLELATRENWPYKCSRYIMSAWFECPTNPNVTISNSYIQINSQEIRLTRDESELVSERIAAALTGEVEKNRELAMDSLRAFLNNRKN